MDNIDITVTSSDNMFTTTKNMGTNTYISIEVPWLGDYSLSYENKTYPVTVDITGGIPFDGLYIKPFSIATWAEITSALSLHYEGKIDISNAWAVGDTKNIHLSAMSTVGTYNGSTFSINESHEAQDVQLVILDFNSDIDANNTNKTLAVSIGLKDCLLEKGNIDASYNRNSWSQSQRHKWCNSIFKDSLPTELNNIIKATQRKCYSTSGASNGSTVTFNTYITLPSMGETTGGGYYKDGVQYNYYKTSANRIKNVNGTNSIWWTRTYYGYSSGTGIYNWYYTNASGDNAYASPTNTYGLSPEFCI